jgi:hypothetical protein
VPRASQVVAALALGEVTQDRVRLGEDEAVVLQGRNARDRIQGDVRVGPGLAQRYVDPLVLQPELGEQEADLEGVRRDRVVVQAQHGRGA